MSKQLESTDEPLAAWINDQHVFFVATALLATNGHINCSPKGGNCFRILGLMEVAYLDYTGSGVEMAAHLKENRCIVLMFCGFDGKPNVVRLHGDGHVLTPEDAEFEPLSALFPPNPGMRVIIRVTVSRVSTSCGFSVPLMDYRQTRDTLDRWAEAKGPEGLDEYRALKNTRSVDGLPALSSKRTAISTP